MKTLASIKFDKSMKIIYTYLIVLIPILDIYASFVHTSIGIGDLLLILLYPFLIVTLIYKKYKLSFDIYNIFLLVFLGMTLFSILFLQEMNFSLSDVMLRSIRDLLYTITFLLFAPILFEVDKGIKCYQNIVLICCAIIFIQYAIFVFTGNAWFPIMEDKMLLGGTNSNIIISDRVQNVYYNNFMASAFFLERGDFSMYTLPYVCICLFYNKKRKYLLAIVTSIAIIISTSASGMIGLFVIWFGLIIEILISKKKKIKDLYIIFIGIATVFIAASFVIVATNIPTQIYNRIIEVKVGFEGVQSSGYLRLFKGYDLFDKMPMEYKLFGIGTGNLVIFANSNYNIMKKFFEGGMLEYMNGLSYILVSGGLFSLIIYLFCLKRYFKNGTKLIKFLIILTLILLGLASFYGSTYYLLMFTIIFSLKQDIVKKETSNSLLFRRISNDIFN